MKIAILYICTGKYSIFWKDFYLSCEKYFIPNTEKEYFVFTDSNKIDFEDSNKNIHKIYQKNLGWPDNTLLRYDIFLKNVNFWQKCDYSFFFNANLIFINNISSEEFLPSGDKSLIACLHPGFFDKNRKDFTYEKNKKSLAFIPKDKGDYYIAGGINGGKTVSFIKVAKILKEKIDLDRERNIIAVWHDESHWNNYVANNKDIIKIISPSYLYPEDKVLPFDKKIVILDKNKYGGHNNLRGEKIRLKDKIIKLVKKVIKKVIN